MALVDWTPEYEGSPAVWLDGADAESIDVVNGAVAVFGDRSGNGRNASQATAASRPANGASLLNGKNTIRFDGTDDYLTFGTVLNTLSQATVFIVVRVDADPPTASKSGLWTMGDGADHTHYPYTDGNVYDSFGTAVRKSLGNPAPALTGWRIYSVHSRDGAWEAWLDDVLIFSTATNTFGISGDSHLGLSFLSLNHFLDGDVAEFLLYEGSGAISTELRENTVGYLAHKWALTGNLDPEHTYKDSAPKFDLPSSIFGEITGTVEIAGSPAQRQLIAISYQPQEHEGEETPRRIVVGETVSAVDGTYTLQTPGFLGEAIVLALDNYGEVWRPNRAYTVGQRIRPTFGNETGFGYDVTIDGDSGTDEPTWWIPAGGSDTGSIGTATAQAKPLWWSVAHAPILPTPIGAVLWTPAEIDLAGCPLWLDAPSSDTITLISGALSNWEDKSGNARNASQTTAAARPVVTAGAMNGLDIIQLDGVDDFLNISGLTATAGIELFFAVRQNESAAARSGGIGLFTSYSTQQPHFGGGTDGPQDWYETFFSTGRVLLGSVQIPPGDYIGSIQQTGSSVRGFIGDEMVGEASATFNGSPSILRVGTNVGGFIFSEIGYGELILLQSPSADLRARAQGYLAHRWGQAARLAVEHPYKDAPPTL